MSEIERELSGDLSAPIMASSEGLEIVKPKIGLCSDKVIMWNLGILVIQWIASSFDYYMMTFFLKYVPGNIYVNTSINAMSSIAAYVGSAYLFKKLGGKISFLIAYAIAIAGGICIMFFSDLGGLWMAFFVLLASFGISFAFNLTYM